MIGLRIAFAATSLSLFATPAAANPGRLPTWQVDWGDQYCILIRSPDRETPYTFALRVLPGSTYSSILLMAEGSGRPPDAVGAVALAPSGRSFEVSRADEFGPNGERVISLRGVPVDFPEAFAGSDELDLKHGSQAVARIPLVNSAGAVRVLRQCISNALREWGVDEAALAALGRRPASTNDFGIRASDYPPAAIRRGIQGRVVVRVDVSAQGRVTGCTPVATSHTREIDAAACSGILRRGRFTPALNQAGEPTASQIVTTVLFVMP